MTIDKIEANRKRLRRLRVLQTLQYGRPEPMGDGLCNTSLKGEVDLGMTVARIRIIFDYLEQRGLLIIVSRDSNAWIAKITADGVDYLDGMGDDLDGVARPDEF